MRTSGFIHRLDRGGTGEDVNLTYIDYPYPYGFRPRGEYWWDDVIWPGPTPNTTPTFPSDNSTGNLIINVDAQSLYPNLMMTHQRVQHLIP